MAAVFPTLGPVQTYVRNVAGGAWQYLGTAVTAPDEEVETFLLPLMCDQGGRSLPVDYVNDRRRAMVTINLGRWNRTTARFFRNDRPSTASASFYSEVHDLNGLPTQPNTSFQLLLVNEFVANGITPSSDQPAGRCYFCAIPRKFRETRVGTRAVECGILIECISMWTVATRRFDLYTEDPNYWGSVTPE